MEVPHEETSRYGVIAAERVGRPARPRSPAQGVARWSRSRSPPDAPSNLAIIGRYVLTPKIFDKLEQTQRGAGGEIQLTDAIGALMEEQDVYAYEFEGTRYDAGTTMGWLKASVELALQRPDLARRVPRATWPGCSSDRRQGRPWRYHAGRSASHVGDAPIHVRGARLAEIGTILGGRYRLVELLGQGGMATIYRAVDTQLGRDVAVKLLRPEYLRDPDFSSRFRQEAQNAASLNHPNVVTVYDYGEDPSGPYIVMEYVDGEDLATILRRNGSLPPAQAARIAAAVARALAAAHARGIVHRDVKPGNVLIGRDGRVKVADFGIARAVAEAQMTLPGTTLGSVHYFSPEQARGESATNESDIYALGIVLYEMLTGSRPWEGDSAAGVALARLSGPVPDPAAGAAVASRPTSPRSPARRSRRCRSTASRPPRRWPTRSRRRGRWPEPPGQPGPPAPRVWRPVPVSPRRPGSHARTRRSVVPGRRLRRCRMLAAGAAGGCR